MAEEPIPRPIRYKFQTVAQEVCDLAKVDYWEQSEVASSLREQMEISYWAYESTGDYKDDAEAKALKDFGSSEEVARVHRGGWLGLWCRLLFSERYTVYRLVGPVVFGMMHSFLRIEGSLKVSVHGAKFVWFGWQYYFGVIIIAVTVLSRFAKKSLPIPKQFGELIAEGVAVVVFGYAAAEWMKSMEYWFVGIQIEDYNPRWLNLTAGMIYLIGYLVEAVSFFFVFALATAEIFEIPACHRAVIEAKRKRNLATVGIWALWLDNCFRALSGQIHGLEWKKAR